MKNHIRTSLFAWNVKPIAVLGLWKWWKPRAHLPWMSLSLPKKPGFSYSKLKKACQTELPRLQEMLSWSLLIFQVLVTGQPHQLLMLWLVFCNQFLYFVRSTSNKTLLSIHEKAICCFVIKKHWMGLILQTWMKVESDLTCVEPKCSAEELESLFKSSYNLEKWFFSYLIFPLGQFLNYVVSQTKADILHARYGSAGLLCGFY